jgi:hypothetical protein
MNSTRFSIGDFERRAGFRGRSELPALNEIVDIQEGIQ